MTRSAVLSASTTSTKKRKATGGHGAAGKEDAEARNKRRKTLEAFFAPQVTVKSPTKNSKGFTEVVALNTEQCRVLQMVVDEGKNVFFTGPAGTPISLCVSSWCLQYR